MPSEAAHQSRGYTTGFICSTRHRACDHRAMLPNRSLQDQGRRLPAAHGPGGAGPHRSSTSGPGTAVVPAIRPAATERAPDLRGDGGTASTPPSVDRSSSVTGPQRLAAGRDVEYAITPGNMAAEPLLTKPHYAGPALASDTTVATTITSAPAGNTQPIRTRARHSAQIPAAGAAMPSTRLPMCAMSRKRRGDRAGRRAVLDGEAVYQQRPPRVPRPPRSPPRPQCLAHPPRWRPSTTPV